MILLKVTVFWLASAAVPAVVAEVAYCTDSKFRWSYNSLGQDPCTVAMVLSQPCGGYTFAPLVSGQKYTPAVVDACTCNTVRYSLISACAACQNGTWLPFSNYSQSCTQTFSLQFPETIPNTTRVPHWAYLPLTSNGTFNIDAASSADGAESTFPGSVTPTPTPTSTSASALTSGSPSTVLSTRRPWRTRAPFPPHSSFSSSKSNVGAIAGGTVGGVIGGVLIAGLAFWIYTKRKNAQGTSIWSGREILASPPPSSWTPNSAQYTVYPTPLRPYDPDDPSTFPPSRDQLVQMSMGSLHSTDRGRRYSAMPEF